jgi:hypothetical protein
MQHTIRSFHHPSRPSDLIPVSVGVHDLRFRSPPTFVFLLLVLYQTPDISLYFTKEICENFFSRLAKNYPPSTPMFIDSHMGA